MDNNIHADEKCFFMTKTAVKCYLRRDEDEDEPFIWTTILV
jgi:hypothetical protein